MNAQNLAIAAAVFTMAAGMVMFFPKAVKADEGSNAVCKTMVIEGRDISGKYDISWAEGKMDLTQVDLCKGTVKIELTGSFSGSKVYISPETPIIIKGSASFGDIRFPDATGAECGKANDNLVFKSKNYDETKPHIDLTISVSFGEVKVLNAG